jgi:trehalose-6-phosphatase
MKIAALFTDYDGTLAPADVRREDSAVPAPLLSVLSDISSRIPVAIVTSKDMEFVVPRTPFAWAWSTVLGLEVRLKDGSGVRAPFSGDLRGTLDRVAGIMPSKVIVEEKRGTDGSLLGVSLDWRLMPGPPPAALKVAEARFRAEGFQVGSYAGAKYMDVYVAHTDKGLALRELVNLLGVRGPVMYLGDTEADNEAFEACEVGVCVEHSQRVEGLVCDYVVRNQELPSMLAALLESGFEFEEALMRAPKEVRKE